MRQLDAQRDRTMTKSLGPGAPLGGAIPTYRIYASADGHVALDALEPYFASRVHEHVGQTATELTKAFATRTTADWEAIGLKLDLPLAGIHVSTPGGTHDQS